MPLENAFIPYGVYWSTPFCRWQGALGQVHAIELAANVASDVLREKKLEPSLFDALVLGMTVPQKASFYGAPWLAGVLGATAITGPTISQACATSARVIANAASEVELGQRACVLAIAVDRTSNGPHVYYPAPGGPGGKGDSEDWVFDAFNHDPFAKNAMVQTAENVAREAGFSREQQDEVTALRYEQYDQALADGRAFQKRFIAPVTLRRGKKEIGKVETDEGVHKTTRETLGGLKPVVDGGSITFGTQTHPADGNAGIVVTTRERARELSRDPKLEVRLLAWGEARVERGMMPKAVVPAARHALARAGITAAECKAVKTHNPFAVNDLYFCRELGFAHEAVNRFGSSLVYGHPQGPTGMRALIELVEELALAGGGYALFSGCAAGDSAMAWVIRVG